ncbi:hypothetical protein G9A89_013645 [Geosiphon pyriformis]|nr:hypothetical protein G9A89_013645 [Geosiphon pyriformis]
MEPRVITRRRRGESNNPEILVSEGSSGVVNIEEPQNSIVSTTSQKRPFTEVIDLTLDDDSDPNQEELTESSLSLTFTTPITRVSSRALDSQELSYRECPLCTFHNHPALLECEICSTALVTQADFPTEEQLQQMQMIEMDHVLALQLQQELGWAPNNSEADEFDEEDDDDEEDEDDDDDDDQMDTEDEGRIDESEDGEGSESDESELEENVNPGDPRRVTPIRPRVETTPIRPDSVSGSCGICLEIYNRLEYGSAVCPDAFCVECWHVYLETKSKDHKFPCRCPAPRCRSVVMPDDAERLFRLKPAPSVGGNRAGYANNPINDADHENLIKNFRHLHEEATMENTTTTRIFCPGPDDSFTIGSTSSTEATDIPTIIITTTTDELVAPKNLERGHWICATCLVSWHVKLTCKAFQHLEREKGNAGTLEEQQTLNAIRNQKLQKCPSCGFWVAKRNGCNHIVCVVRATKLDILIYDAADDDDDHTRNFKPCLINDFFTKSPKCGEDFCYRCGRSYNTKPKCRGDH